MFCLNVRDMKGSESSDQVNDKKRWEMKVKIDGIKGYSFLNSNRQDS